MATESIFGFCSRVGMLLAAMLLASGPLAASSVQKVPPGNRNLEQPRVPGSSARRTGAMHTTYEAKYRRVHALFQRDARLRDKIKQVAGQYNIDPLHMVGAIIGEHTYNVDAYDRLQAYYVKAISYVSSNFSFSYNGESIDEFISRPEFESCRTSSDSYSLWTCREQIWDMKFRGRKIDGKSFPADRFSSVFFQPFYAGQTFGIGQLNPLTALQMTDFVVKASGMPPLSHLDPQQVYRTIMDPDLTLPYIAATLRKSIDAYRDIAGFDISGNPGITATLYNLGDPEARARRLAAENRRRAANGLPPQWPQENYYGWLVNDRLAELKALFQ